MTPNQRGALFMSASMAGFAVEDVLVKAAAREMPLAQVLLVIGLAGMLAFAAMTARRGEALFPAAFLGVRRLHPRGPQLRTMHFHQRPLHYPERRLSIRNEPYPLQHRQPRPLHHPDHRVSVRNHPYPSQHRPSQPLIGNPPPHRHHPSRRASINPQAGQNQQDRRPDHRMQRPQQSPRFNHSGRQQWRPQFQR